MTKQSRVERLSSLESLWFHLRTPGYAEFARPNGEAIAINVQGVLSVRPSAPGSGNTRIVCAEPAGEYIVVGEYDDVLDKVKATALLPGNAGV